MHADLGEVVYKLTSVSFCHSPDQGTWRPAINAYRCELGFRICVDLAGVSKEAIQIHVEPGRLVFRGERTLPEPNRQEHAVQILAMEIDHGTFARAIDLPNEVDVDQVTANQENGLLWITLPFASDS
jgi:HSP20 family protein